MTLVALGVAAVFVAVPRPAAAEVYHPWCARLAHVTGTLSCIFDTRSQCMQSVAYGEGYCIKNVARDAEGMDVRASNGPHRHVWRNPDIGQQETPAWTPAPELAGCTWPYRNMAPPCWSTWPEGDPNYHGWNGK